MQMLVIGVDIAKDTVVVAQPGQTPRVLPNRRGPLLAWLKTLPPGSRVAMEATGRYHVLLADLAYGLGLSVYVLALGQALQRIPFATAQAFVAYTGLDPRPMDSGHKVGRRRLSKRGPAELRRLLYTAAMSASKTKLWKPLYLRQRAKGLSATAALVILARKIARIAWSVYHHQTSFDPNRLLPA